MGSQLTEEVVECFGAAFADELDLAGEEFVVGHDMRDSSPGFAAAFSLGARKRGANAVMLGLCSTDMNYYASGLLDLPGAMFTASHNPASYNGIKLSRAGARGILASTLDSLPLETGRQSFSKLEFQPILLLAQSETFRLSLTIRITFANWFLCRALGNSR